MTGRTEPRLADISPAPSVDDLLQSAAGAPTDATETVAVPLPEATPITRRRTVDPAPTSDPVVETPVEPVVETPAPEPVDPPKPAKTRPAKTRPAKSAKPAAKKPAPPLPAEAPVQPPLPTAPEAEISAQPIPPMPIPELYPAHQEPTVQRSPAEPGPVILPVARFAPPAPEPAREVAPEPVPQPAQQAAQQAHRPASVAPVRSVEDHGELGLTVQEVADAAMERLRDAENATLRHLAALEAEAQRRAELLTAQAELDAELIRITARREAHAIISAARAQTGGSAAGHAREMRQLGEISDAVSRFAESVDASVAPLRGTDDGGRP